MQNVTKDREKYIGGSDIPAILNISPFKSRYRLLQEKAQIVDIEFRGNEYTEYGNELEPQIRDYLSSLYKTQFVEDKRIDGSLRYHADGYSKEIETVIEIKTTSQIKKSVSDYQSYLCQLVQGMKMFNAPNGVLAVYERPKNFDTHFQADRLKIYDIKLADYEELARGIDKAVEGFLKDLEKMKANPFITEEELAPNEIVLLSNKVLALESKLTNLKELEKELKGFKEQLKKTMEQSGWKKWTTNSGVKLTLVADTEPKIVDKFDEKAFEKDHKELYEEYLKPSTQRGRSGYVRITMPK